MKFRKKPVVVEAIRVSEAIYGLVRQPHALPQWVRAAHAQFRLAVAGSEMVITTPEGVMRAPGTSWLIKGVKGELYFCLPDVFDATYEEAA